MSTATVLPLFQKYTLDELERLTPYSATYLIAIRDSGKLVRPRFRRVMSKILNEPESALFASDGEK